MYKRIFLLFIILFSFEICAANSTPLGLELDRATQKEMIEKMSLLYKL